MYLCTAVFFAARVHSRRTLAIIIISDDLTSLSRTVGTRTKKNEVLIDTLQESQIRVSEREKLVKAILNTAASSFFPSPGETKMSTRWDERNAGKQQSRRF